MSAGTRPPFRVGIIGTRGIPNRHGGFERFTEVLVEHPGWAGTGIEFVVYGESEARAFNAWTRCVTVGVDKARRGLTYYRRSAAQAARECDAVMSCGVGISVFAFLVRWRSASLIVNPDGCEWRRSKWSAAGRVAIKAMYWPAMAAADRIVIDAEALREDFGLPATPAVRYIGYQAPPPAVSPLREETRRQWQLERPFALCIARLEPENNVEMIVRAFRALGRPDAELLVVGPTTTPHFQAVLSGLAGPGVRFLGPIYDQAVLQELRGHCTVYLHGHSVGGTNPSLLEALSSVQGALLCHDNKYNREVAGDEAAYFSSGETLQQLLADRLDNTAGAVQRRPRRDQRFDPDHIFRAYLALFEDLRAARQHL